MQVHCVLSAPPSLFSSIPRNKQLVDPLETMHAAIEIYPRSRIADDSLLDETTIVYKDLR